ncbi:MAG TPA: NADH-quinone oxidoreductase subunit M, partial [Polyangia bacterium]|nr:NADH-quinone oxidoreductase subunit M [Polyangia bacterium]
MKHAYTLAFVAVAAAVTCGAVAHADNAPSFGGEHGRARLDVSPASLRFDGAGQQTLTLHNRGAAPLQLYRVTKTDDSPGFAVDDPGHKTLQPGETLVLQARFIPDGKRAQAFGAVQIVSDDATQPIDPGDTSLHVTAVALQYGSSWLLTLMIFFPLAGAVLILLAPAGRHNLTRGLALATTLVPLATAIFLCAHFDPTFAHVHGNGGLQFVQHVVWIPSFHVEYFVGVDGLSIAMVLLTALISTIAVLASFNIERDVRGYFALFLLLETGMLGTFCALDFFLFYVFWELMLLPMYFLIGIWGGPRKEYAAIKFFLYTLAGSVLMLLAIIALYYNAAPTTLVDGTPAAHTFDMVKLAYANDWSAKGLTLFGLDFTHVVWVAFFIGFAIKVPMFPFHTWLPDAHVEAPTGISVILAGVLLKMGIYGMLRVNFAMLPVATQWAATTIAIFGAINILYGALCAFAQRDLKKLVAYSSVSHMGYCLVGIAAFTKSGFDGAMLQLFNHGTITAMLFLLVGVLYDRAHTRDLDRFGGIATQMPRYAALFGFAFMASLGLPGLSGFIGELLVFLGAFPVHRAIVLVAALGVVITAAYHLWALQRVQLGAWNPAWPDRRIFTDLTLRETLTLVPLAAIVLVLGFY